MFYRKITFARVRMLVLTCVMLLAIFGQIGVERTAKCFNCERAVCLVGSADVIATTGLLRYAWTLVIGRNNPDSSKLRRRCAN
jgi:predicted RecB family endonuclease